MPRKINADGRIITVPDDATPEEINEIVGPESGSEPLTPSGQPMRPLPERTPDALDLVQKTPQFVGDLGRAAKKNLSDAWQGVKSNFTDAGKTLKEDPTRILPMWFGGGMKALASAGNIVATPVTYALQGDISSAVSSAAGGDPEQAQKYAQEGNAGGEFWEMAGKPLLLIAGGEVLGKVGGGLSEGASVNRLRVVRGMMSDASAGKAGIDLADAQLAQQALQDAARETYGVGKKGESSLAKALPGRDLNLSNIIKGEPGTVSVVDQGNKALRDLTRKAVDLAGRPADEVNNLYGYLPGKDASLNIQRNLISQAEEAERNGLTSYGRALRERAAALDNKNTLGQIYDVKKSANRMAGVARNTQEAIDLMDSWSALASAIRQEVYPRYQQMVGGEFNLAQAGRKEGAAMSLRNGVEKRMARVQEQTDALHTPGETLSQMQHGVTKHHTLFGTAVREAREHGILPSPEGELNKSGRKAIGRLSPDTVPESVKVEKGATFSAAAPTRLALPGKAMQFEIPGNLPTLGREGQITHSATQVPRHSFESPAYTTSSAPTRTSSFAPNGRIIAGPEGSAGADISTARVPEPQTDVAKGPGTLITSDVNVARQTLDRMTNLINHHGFDHLPGVEQTRILRTARTLRKQITEYDRAVAGGASVTHVPAKTTYVPRKTGKLPASHPIRKALPVGASSYEREEDYEHR